MADSIGGGLLLSGTMLIWGCGNGECNLSFALGLVGFGTYLLASPLIHLSKNNAGSAGLSLLLRVGLPAAGIALTKLGDGGDDLFSLSVLGGAGAAMTIDWLFLAHRDKPIESHIIPMVAPTQDGLTVGFSGMF